MAAYLIERSRHLLVGEFLHKAAQLITLGTNALEFRELCAVGDEGRGGTALPVADRGVGGQWYPGRTST